jgi:hypothetical protein
MLTHASVAHASKSGATAALAALCHSQTRDSVCSEAPFLVILTE